MPSWSKDTLAAEAEEPDSTQAAPEGDSTAVEEPDEGTGLSDLEFQALHRLDVSIVGPGETRTVTLRPEEPWEIRDAAAFRPGGDASFSLPGIYGVGGLFRDTNRDLVPDETAAFISLSRDWCAWVPSSTWLPASAWKRLGSAFLW